MKYCKILLFIILFAFTGCLSPEMRTAKIALNEKDYFRAIESLNQELQRISDNAEVWYLKGYSYEKLADWSNMAESYDRSLELSEQFKLEIEVSIAKLVSRYYNKSVMMFDSSIWDTAIFYLDTAIIIDKNNFRLHRQAAITAYRGDNFDLAIDFCLAAIKSEPSISVAREDANEHDNISEPDYNIDSRKIILSIYSESKDYKNMIVWSKNIIDRIEKTDGNPNDYLSGLDELIEAYEALNEDDEAESVILTAMEKFPDNIQLRLNLATYKSRREDYQGAVMILEKVLLSEALNVYANMTVGTILIMEKKYEEAIPYLEKVIAVEPDNKSALQNLFSAYYNTGQDKKGGEIRKRWEKLKE